MDSIKNDYKTYLATPKGKDDLAIAIRSKRAWKESMSRAKIKAVSTDSIQMKHIHPEIALLAQKVVIEPIALNNLCHSNSEWFKSYGYDSQLGYNLTACPCGKIVCMEIHTLNVKNGKLHDFTRDFNDEKHKWFVPLPVEFGMREFIKIWGRDRDFIKIDTGCRCFQSMAGDEIKKMEWDEVIQFINNHKNFRVWF
jgi:hypothetical protein